MLGATNFRTRNLVNNMHLAHSVTEKDSETHIEFLTEYYDSRAKQTRKSRIVYRINSNLVKELKREKS